MNRKLFYLGTAAVGALATAMPRPALAQAGDVAPPARYQLDQNGVNLATGTYEFEKQILSIGPDGPGGLAYVVRTGPGQYGIFSNWAQAVYQSGTNWSASIGFTSRTFTQSGSTFTSTDGSGATLTQIGSGGTATWTLTDGDGTKIVYDYLGHDDGDATLVARAGSITYPTGDKVTLSWNQATICSNNLDGCSGGTYNDRVRMESVVNSSGYKLQLNYGTSLPLPRWRNLASIAALDMAVDTSCTPGTESCAGSQSWPTAVAKPSDAGASPFVVTLKDAAGDTTILTDYDTSYTIQRPTSASANTTIGITSYKVSSVATDGRTWGYGYTTSGTTLTATVTDPMGHQNVVVSDMNVGLPTSVKDPLLHTTSYHYNASGELDKATASEGNYVSYEYDSRGNLKKTTAVSKTPGTPADIVTQAVYPSTCTNILTCNKPSTTIDANGNQTDYTYDPTHGGVLTVTAPAPATGGVRPQTRYTYSALQAYYKNGSGSIVASGVPEYRLTAVSACRTTSSCTGGADESKTTIGYGPQTAGTANNLLPVSVSSGSGDGLLTATTVATYDSIGNLLTVDGPLSGTADTTRLRYDAARRQIGVTGPDPDGAGSLKMRGVRTTYNADGQVTKSEQGTVNSASDADWASFAPLQASNAVYDVSGRVTQRSASAGSTTYALTQYSYDADGRLDCAAVRMKMSAFGSLPASACTLGTLSVYGPDRIAQYHYDDADKVTSVVSALGTADQRTDVTTSYGSNNEVLTVKDAESNLTTYEYDGFGRLSKTRYPSSTKGAGTSSTTDYEQLTYDAASNVATRRLRDGNTITYSYDDLERLKLKDIPSGELNVNYAYDNQNRLTSAWTTAQTLTFGYDALGRNTSQGGPEGTIAYQYDLAGERTRMTWPDAFYVTYDHLVTGEVSAIRENGAASGVGVLATFGYDNLGERTSLTRGNGTSTSYGYDPVSRLTSLTQDLAGTTNDLTLTLGSYDPAGEIGTRTASNDAYAYTGSVNQAVSYTANGRNQYSTVSNLSPAPVYDARGNLTSASGFTGGYSLENLLTTAGAFTLDYDPAMRLYQIDSSATSAIRFQYDGTDMVGEYNSSNVLQRRFVHGPGTDEPLVWYEGSGTTDRRFLHADERGSVIAISNSAGTSIGTNSYDEYGVPASTNTGRFQYTGQEYLSEIGVSYYKARMYAPSLGRFLQTDPIGYGDGLNLYNHVGSNPINFKDPSGLSYDDIVVTGNPFGYFLQALEYFSLLDISQAIGRPNAGNDDNSEITVTGRRIANGKGAKASPPPPQSGRDESNCSDSTARATQAAYTPSGDTKGENPTRRGSGYVTELPGGFLDATAVFQGLARLAGDTHEGFGGIFEPSTLVISEPSGIRLRIGIDLKGGFAPRIDIPAGTFDLKAHESIHFTGGKGNMCPSTAI